MKISKLQLATLSLLVSSVAFASELKVVDSSGATRLVAELPGQSRTALEVIAKSTAPTEGVEVQLSALESGGDIISIRLTNDGRGYFNAVPAGSFKIASTANGVAIESVQLVNSDSTGLGMLANSQPAELEGSPEVADQAGGFGGDQGAGDVGTAPGGGGAGGGSGAIGGGGGYGLGAGGIVLAGGGAIAIAATAISEGTEDSSPGSARPTPIPTPPPSFEPKPTPVPTPRPPRPPSAS